MMYEENWNKCLKKCCKEKNNSFWPMEWLWRFRTVRCFVYVEVRKWSMQMNTSEGEDLRLLCFPVRAV